VTLPQRSAFSKAIILPLVLVFSALATPAAAQDASGDDNRQTVFSCGTDVVADQGFLDLSGVPADDHWGDLRFERTGDDGKVDYSFPPVGSDARTAFLFSHSNGPGGYLVSIRWTDGGLNHVYYSLDVRPDPEAEDDMGGGTAGLVTSRDGTLVERISCIERPYMFVSYLREAMSCDVANPYGAAACDDEPFERDDEIDPEAIGFMD
jgi:hypothetical protein